MRVRLCVALLSVMMVGCRSEIALMSLVQDIDRDGWWQGVGFSLNITDTLPRYDLALFLRHESGTIEGETLGVRVDYRTPKGYFSRDTVFIAIDSISGRVGSGYKIARAPYIEQTRLVEQGEYEIRLTPIKRYGYCTAVGVELRESK